MTRQCLACRRLNPPGAAFCFHDGRPLAGGAGTAGAVAIDFSTWTFPRPFVFPNGVRCLNFVMLAGACRQHPEQLLEALHDGFLQSFLASLGRTDLALAAASAARSADPLRSADDLLGKFPGSPLRPAELAVEPGATDLGVLQVGEDHRFELTLTNRGDRLLYGKAAVEDCPWLVLGEGGTAEKLFQFFDRTTIPVRVVGKRLRAYAKPQRVEIAVESNGGNCLVSVKLAVPIKPFPEGVLAGAASPRQLAEKARDHPKEAAVLLENGAVARWYRSNGWPYPVRGPTASGIAAVQQLFETLGLVRTPQVELSETAITLRGRPGERIEYVLTVFTAENRAAVAHAVSDQPWLRAEKTVFRGRLAAIPLLVEAVPGPPGRAQTAWLQVTANGDQRFDVPVTVIAETVAAAAYPHRR
jgi:hypothetical protein